MEILWKEKDMKSIKLNLPYKLVLISLCILVMTGCGKDKKMSDENENRLSSDSTEISYADENNYEEEDNLDNVEAEDEDLEEIEEDEEEDDDDKNISGIIVVRLQTGSNYVYQDTNANKCTTFTVTLDAINPKTGETTNVRTFSSEDTHSCSLPFDTIYDDTTEFGAYFNSDWSVMGATLSMPDGAQHIGWIDEDGDFTDVSEMIEEKEDFSGLTIHMKPRFFGDYFYFEDHTERTGGAAEEMRVRIEDLENNETEVKAEKVKEKHSLDMRLRYYDDTKSCEKPLGEFCDWISASECVGIEDDMIYRYKLKKDKNRKDILDKYSKAIPLIPEINGRENGNAVVAPDGNKVAFLSLLTRSTDESYELFVVSAKGGNPVKIDTEYDFSEIDRNEYRHTVRLIDWR